MSSLLYDIPGPKARARNRVLTAVGALVVAGLVALAVWRLVVNDQLDGDRWAVLFDPRTEVPQALLRALGRTLQVAVIGMVLATVLGALLAIGRLSDRRWISRPVTVVVEFFRAVPLLLLILFSFIFIPAIGTPVSPFAALLLGLVLYNMSVLAEIFRSGILSVARGQWEAGYALGLRKSQLMTTVLLPQAVRRMLPVLIAQLVVLLKDTSLGYIVTYSELLRTARSLVEFFGNTYSFQFYVAAAVIYILVNLLISSIARLVERRTRKDRKARAVGPVGLPDEITPVVVPGGGPDRSR
ncbi:amino acid ABC transporter permease [Modestobacter marinus]|uniref:amino acid ABC transporter permease n=1 Tax=Modestobacter marinus TaxID=477641 RepID=UPI001C96B1D9|nr:amino acid ABC transporter permease [Modestobacter marinus]